MSAPLPTTTEPAPGRRRLGRAVLNGAAVTALLLTGLAAGVVGGLYAGWIGWLWMTGGVGLALAAATVAAVALALFAAVRGAGAATGRPGAVALAAGWALPLMVMVWGGENGNIVFSAAGINYAFLFGSVAAVMAGVATTPPPASR
ncbi:DUF6113 family protein [Nocardiopsis coralliicola]